MRRYRSLRTYPGCTQVPDKSQSVHRFWFMLGLIVAGEAVFLLPYYPTRFFRPTVLEIFDLTNTELGAAQGIYGIMAVFGYFLGGPLADRFPARNLLASSLWTTAAGGLYMATFPDFRGALALWGFFRPDHHSPVLGCAHSRHAGLGRPQHPGPRLWPARWRARPAWRTFDVDRGLDVRAGISGWLCRGQLHGKAGSASRRHIRLHGRDGSDRCVCLVRGQRWSPARRTRPHCMETTNRRRGDAHFSRHAHPGSLVAGDRHSVRVRRLQRISRTIRCSRFRVTVSMRSGRQNSLRSLRGRVFLLRLRLVCSETGTLHLECV